MKASAPNPTKRLTTRIESMTFKRTRVFVRSCSLKGAALPDCLLLARLIWFSAPFHEERMSPPQARHLNGCRLHPRSLEAFNPSNRMTVVKSVPEKTGRLVNKG